MDSFKQAVAGGDASRRRLEGRDLSRERREFARIPPERVEIAPEIAFLGALGVGPGVLLQAMRAAERCGASADAALLGEGLISDDLYYRALARHLRVPFFDRELAIDAAVDPAKAIASGIARLKPNGLRLHTVIAPRGASIRYLLAAAAEGRSLGGLVLSSPRRLAAIVRIDAAAKVADAAARDLERRDRALSAHAGLSWPQIASAAAAIVTCAALAQAAAGAAQAAVSALLWLIFAAWIVVRNLAVAAADNDGPCEPLSDEDLPVYSIVAPLHREANMVGRLVKAFDALDYPRAKLDIKFVVERGDADTLAALAALRLPARYEVIVAPLGEPSTKPRALNVALPALRGDLVVVYDAEDTPDPDQLRLAAARFARDGGLDCLQARLTIENSGDSWISRMFAIEYAALFDLINPGLATLELPIALGGTSNHFRTRTLRRVGGWDAWNVTEDADLGLRLAREGARVGALRSDTREEAPVDLSTWFRQRVRWQKGWMQTLIVHSRHPARLVGELGPGRALAAAAMIGGAVLGGLFGPALTADVLIRACDGDLASASRFRVAGDVAIYTLMVSGLLTVLAPALVAMRRRDLASGFALASLPLYFALISAASWIAVADLLVRPFYWDKTEHGRSGLANAGAQARGRAQPGDVRVVASPSLGADGC
jgi:cellulose synthase/poly-beta-1,6-N-acetylglucosamine synthase-like glycosyltransferase